MVRNAISKVTSQIRVLMVIPGTEEGSEMIFAKRQVTSLIQSGVRIQTFFLRDRTSLKVLARDRKTLLQVIRVFKPDLVHAQYGTITAFLCAMLTKTPLIITLRGSDLNYRSSNPLRCFAGILLSQLASLRASQIICVSKEIRKKLWWRRRLATIIPSGVDTSLFKPRPINLVRSLLGWKREESVVLFNGGNRKEKGSEIAKASFNMAASKLADSRLVILDGKTEPGAIPFLMNAANCLLLTSEYEGSPNVVKEGMACNLPVVSVDVGDVKERLKDVIPSRVVARDPKELGQALIEIVNSSQRSNGYSIIQKNLTLQRIAEQIVGVYQKALMQA